MQMSLASDAPGTFRAVCDASVTSKRAHAGLGIVAAARDGRRFALGLPAGGITNTILAEALAVAVTLERLPAGSVVALRTDCEAVVRHVTTGTGTGALEGHPVWMRLQAAAARHARVKIRWIRGHAGHPRQVLAHTLAKRATHGSPVHMAA